MKTYYLFFFLLICFAGGLLAQETESGPLDTFSRDPIPILIEPMRYPEGLPPDLVAKIEGQAYTALENHWHYQVINHSAGEGAGDIDPEYIFQLSLEPIVDELSQRDIIDSNKQVIGRRFYLTGGIAANLRVTDIVSGELKYTRDIKITHSSVGNKYFSTRTFHFTTGKTPPRQRPYSTSPDREALILQDEKNKLLTLALEGWGKNWSEELLRIFPTPIHIIKVLDGSDKKPKELLIDAGHDFGLQKNGYLEIITIKVYEALGEQFVKYVHLGNFYTREVQANSCTGKIFGGRKEVGEALAAGLPIFLRKKE